MFQRPSLICFGRIIYLSAERANYRKTLNFEIITVEGVFHRPKKRYATWRIYLLLELHSGAQKFILVRHANYQIPVLNPFWGFFMEGWPRTPQAIKVNRSVLPLRDICNSEVLVTNCLIRNLYVPCVDVFTLPSVIKCFACFQQCQNCFKLSKFPYFVTMLQNGQRI